MILSGVSALLTFRSTPKITQSSKNAVNTYHASLRAGNCQGTTSSQLYSDIGSESLEKLTTVCDVMNRQYGNLIESHLLGSSIHTSSNYFEGSGKYVTLEYNSQFSNSTIREIFTWKFDSSGELEFDSYKFLE